MKPARTTVQRWSGIEIRALREAQRISLREFAAHLGVSDRIAAVGIRAVRTADGVRWSEVEPAVLRLLRKQYADVPFDSL